MDAEYPDTVKLSSMVSDQMNNIADTKGKWKEFRVFTSFTLNIQ